MTRKLRRHRGSPCTESQGGCAADQGTTQDERKQPSKRRRAAQEELKGALHSDICARKYLSLRKDMSTGRPPAYCLHLRLVSIQCCCAQVLLDELFALLPIYSLQ